MVVSHLESKSLAYEKTRNERISSWDCYRFTILPSLIINFKCCHRHYPVHIDYKVSNGLVLHIFISSKKCLLYKCDYLFNPTMIDQFFISVIFFFHIDGTGTDQ